MTPYEEALFEGYFDALNEISEPVPGYRNQLQKDKDDAKQISSFLDGDRAKRAYGRTYRSNRKLSHTIARTQMPQKPSTVPNDVKKMLDDNNSKFLNNLYNSSMSRINRRGR